MATTESSSDAGSIDESEIAEASPNSRTVSALTEVMTVMDSVGRARNADDLFLVNSSSGSEYLYDTRTGSCECPWKQYNPEKECKHEKRVAFATGEQPIPQWVDDDALDDQFGMHVDGESSKAVADGGVMQVRFNDGGVTDPTEDPLAVTSEDEPRTKRAKREDIDVSFLAKPGRYEVHSASESRYEVDVLEETCSCPDTAERCKHRRRVEIEIEAKRVPRPDGKLPDA
ncbi:SWIM zinc finger family protein [Haloarcula sp. H-GB4]|uniref:SWIM zinc finger family protein n=1 Tax=Haloarcula sp. H-GB4 TaxID=3069755 RepID=UPI0027AF1F5D|nr:SWIM zinc finger family protein [Haloarcula sp. H-GB4]MDQ2074820.1 SWIM zinc finger family protein [Haloarcula sp. H-GB4]